MEKLSAVMGIMVMSIASAVLIPSVSAANAIPVSTVTYSYAPVMGGGCQIPSPLAQGDKAHFNFEVQYEDGGSSGLFHLMDHGNATIPKIKVHSELITTLELSENNATFTGTARSINKAATPPLFMLRITESRAGRKVINSIYRSLIPQALNTMQ